MLNKKTLIIKRMILFISFFLYLINTSAQTIEKINWINFSQLNDSLKVNPKKVIVDFYANWCSICHEMENTTFSDRRVIEIINKEYYAVKMNIESRDTILFGGQVYTNKRYKKPNPVHEIPLLIGSRKDKPFSLPIIVLLDDEFIAKARYFQFLDAKSLVTILTKKD